MSGIRLLTFDLDDTLWPVEPVIAHANQVQYRWLSEHLHGFSDRFPLPELLRFAQSASRQHPELDGFVTRKRMHLLRAVAMECGLPGPAAEDLAADAFGVFHEARQQVHFFPGVLDVLRELAADYRLCALSNGNADIFRTEAGPMFSAAISAESCGFAKPDARIFHAALEKSGISGAETAHIGDHADTDIQGALGAGLRAIWLNPDAREWMLGAPGPTAEIHEFGQLPAAVEALQRSFH